MENETDENTAEEDLNGSEENNSDVEIGSQDDQSGEDEKQDEKHNDSPEENDYIEYNDARKDEHNGNEDFDQSDGQSKGHEATKDQEENSKDLVREDDDQNETIIDDSNPQNLEKEKEGLKHASVNKVTREKPQDTDKADSSKNDEANMDHFLDKILKTDQENVENNKENVGDVADMENNNEYTYDDPENNDDEGDSAMAKLPPDLRSTMKPKEIGKFFRFQAQLFKALDY
jgi:hypothetical protein